MSGVGGVGPGLQLPRAGVPSAEPLEALPEPGARRRRRWE